MKVSGELAEHKHGPKLTTCFSDRCLSDQTLPVHVHRLQTEAHLPQVEQVPGNEAPMERQVQIEQCDLEMLAHAVHQGSQETCLCLCQSHGT